MVKCKFKIKKCQYANIILWKSTTNARFNRSLLLAMHDTFNPIDLIPFSILLETLLTIYYARIGVYSLFSFIFKNIL